MKTLSAALKAAKNLVESGDAWLFLYEITLDATNTLYLASSTEDVVFSGTTYKPAPVRIGQIRETVRGNLEEVDLIVLDLTGEVQQIVEDFDVDGADVKILVVNSANLAASTDAIPETFQIRNWKTKNGDVWIFTLGHPRFLETEFPGRRFYRTRCSWVYKDPLTCQYSGSLPTCDRTLDGPNGCRVHVNVPRFGGAPGIPRGRFVV